MDKDFIKKLLAGNIYDYSKSSDENVEAGNALMSPNAINTMSQEDFLKANPDLYVRRTPEEMDAPAPIAPVQAPVIAQQARVVPTATPKALPMNTPDPKSVVPELSLSDKLNALSTQSNGPDNSVPGKIDLASLLANAQVETDNGELKSAQDKRNELLRQIMLIRGANKVGSAIAGVDPTKDYLTGLEGYANQGVADVEQRRKAQADLKKSNLENRNQTLSEVKSQADLNKQNFDMGLQKEDQGFQRRNQAIGEMKADFDLKKADFELGDKKKENDPNSDLSKAFNEYARSYAKMAGANIKIPDGMSYSDLSKQMGTLGNVVAAKMAQDARKEVAADNAANRNLQREQMKSTQSGKFLNTIDQDIKKSDAYKSIKKLNQVQNGLNNALANPSSQSDIDVLYNFVKLLDQDSAVREGEIGLAKSALSMQDNLKNEISRMGPKPRLLSEKFIRGVNQLVGVYSQLANKQLKNETSTKRVIAQRMGVSPEDFDKTFSSILNNSSDDLDKATDAELDKELNSLKR